MKWLKSRNILSCSQNQSGPGLIESRELIPFSLLPQYRSFSLLDTLSPPHLYPTPSWFSTGRALDSCSGLTHFSAYSTHISYKPLCTRSGLTVDCSTNAKGRQGGERGNVSSHTCILEGNMCHSIYPIELEFSCLGYICTTGLELQCCKKCELSSM